MKRSRTRPELVQRKSLRFSLRSGLWLMAGCAGATALAVRFPRVAIAALVVVCAVGLVVAVAATLLAEGLFWDWLDSKLGGDGGPNNKSEQ